MLILGHLTLNKALNKKKREKHGLGLANYYLQKS